MLAYLLSVSMCGPLPATSLEASYMHQASGIMVSIGLLLGSLGIASEHVGRVLGHLGHVGIKCRRKNSKWEAGGSLGRTDGS